MLKAEKQPPVDCPPQPEPIQITLYGPYHPRTAAYLVKSTTETLDGVQKTIEYEYSSDPNHPLLPIESSFQNSDNKTIKTKTCFTYNLAYQCLRDELRAKHIISIPTSTRTYVDDVLVSGDSTRFTNYHSSSGTPEANCTGTANNPNTPYPWKFYRYEVALDDNGNPTSPGIWAEKGEINERYMTNGLPKKFTLAGGWAPEFYEWETNGLIKKRTYVDFIWEYAYHPNTRLLSSIKDIDGQTAGFTYDPLMRLKTTSARGGKILTTYTYDYGTPKEWQSGNRIRTFVDYDGFDDQDTYAYFDGLGRPLDTWRMGYGPNHENIVADKIFYDNQGRVDKKVFMPDIKAALTYSTFTYEQSPLSRPLKETYPDDNSVQTAYGSEGLYYKTTGTDENGHTTATLTDILGRRTEVRDALGNPTTFHYDNKNNLVKVVNPELQEYLYTFDTRNRMTRKTVPGAHCQEFYYEDRDLLWASRDGNLYYGDDPGNPQNKWLVNEYDIYGRIMRTGFGNNNPAVQFPPCGGTITNSDFAISQNLIVNAYDVQGFDCGSSYVPIGKLSSTDVHIIEADGSAGGPLATKYCYDEYGRVKETQSDIFGGGTDQYTTIYDIADHVLQTGRDHNNSEINTTESFLFDHGGRQTVHTHNLVSGIAPNLGTVGLTGNEYNTKDQLSDKLVGGLAGLGYMYNSRGWLEYINQMPFGNVRSSLTCQAPVPPQPPSDPNAGCGECGKDQLTLIQLLQIRFKNALKVDCYIPCDCPARCTPEEVTPCEYPSEPGDLPGSPVVGLKYPTNIFHILDCTGEKSLVWQDSLPVIKRPYAVTGRVGVDSSKQKFQVATLEGAQIVEGSNLPGTVAAGGDIKTHTADICGDCTSAPPTCTEAEAAAQTASMSNLNASLLHGPNGLQYPTNLLRLRLCDGSEIYLFEEELQWLGGKYRILQTIEITNSSQYLTVGAPGYESRMTLGGYMTVRNLQGNWWINYYAVCSLNSCGTVDERYNARSIGPSAIFSTHDNQPPYNDLSALPNAEESFQYDFVTWNINFGTGTNISNAEAEWDLGVAIPPDADLHFYEAHVIIPEMRGDGCRIGLYDGNGWVKINGNQDYVTLPSGTSFPQMPFLVLTPDNLPNLAQVQNMKVAIFVGTKNLKIDAVYAVLDYSQPCDRCELTGPTCTDAETAAQKLSLQNIKTLAAQTPISQIPLPTKLYRVRLCDQSEVYLLQHELALLTGDYVILQSISIVSLTQIFLTNIGPLTPIVAGSPGPRYDLFALKLQYYAGDNNLLAPQGYKNGNIAAMYWEVGGRDRQAYGFRYDALDRLKFSYYADIDRYSQYYNKGIYQEGTVSGLIQYDKIGNILSLRRNGAYNLCDEGGNAFYAFGLIDDLSYAYNTGKTHLTAVTDAVTGDAGKHGFVTPGGHYEYDANGNMTFDEGKGMVIKYNYLNLPREIIKTNDPDENGTIQWVYDATGRKLKKT
ncbi:MAG: RHS repeat protein, partial [Saprospiraceae bacterium]